jgi:hypothetical protein
MVSITSLSEGDRFMAQLGQLEVALEVVGTDPKESAMYADGVEVRQVDVKTGEFMGKGRVMVHVQNDDKLKFRKIFGSWKATDLKAVWESDRL